MAKNERLLLRLHTATEMYHRERVKNNSFYKFMSKVTKMRNIFARNADDMDLFKEFSEGLVEMASAREVQEKEHLQKVHTLQAEIKGRLRE